MYTPFLHKGKSWRLKKLLNKAEEKCSRLKTGLDCVLKISVAPQGFWRHNGATDGLFYILKKAVSNYASCFIYFFSLLNTSVSELPVLLNKSGETDCEFWNIKSKNLKSQGLGSGLMKLFLLTSLCLPSPHGFIR